jgi:hypothetical protein
VGIIKNIKMKKHISFPSIEQFRNVIGSINRQYNFVGLDENVISSFNCESSDGLVKTRPQGIKEDMMIYITENQPELMGKIVKVKCNGLSKDKDGNYSLLYPAFMEIRDDKTEADSLETIKNVEDMIKILTTV